ncbi:MAG: zinc ribbon domain-containing protein [Pirellulaceae bacterium]
MSFAASTCPKCGTQNLNSSKFCGGCGSACQHGSVPVQPQYETGPYIRPANDRAWHRTASVICGILSMLLCGALASIPGIYFGYSALQDAKTNGQSTTVPWVGIGLNVAGIVFTILGILLGLMISMMQMSGGGGYGAYGNYYGY